MKVLRKKQQALFSISALTVIIWVSTPGVAHAYIDPGNGAYMVQALFTIAGAALFYMRHPIRSIRAMKEWVILRLKRNSAREVDVTPERTLQD